MDVQRPGQAAPAWGQILPLREEPEAGGSYWVMVAFPCRVSSELCLPSAQSATDFLLLRGSGILHPPAVPALGLHTS